METFPLYTGLATSWGSEPWRFLPVTSNRQFRSADGYIPDEGLKAAVNVSLILGLPLLVTGEPGTGKALLAYSISAGLGMHDPLVFVRHSDTKASDIFYRYDAIEHFRASQIDPQTADAVHFITYNALGEAILLTLDNERRAQLLPTFVEIGQKRRSVVLIDEVDKAPRDVLNDILNEIEEMSFRIPQLSNIVVSADEHMKPVAVFTSNNERALPDAFMRRCIYYHIEFPDRNHMTQIIDSRVGSFLIDASRLLHDVLDFFYDSRKRILIGKRPGTAELLAWLVILQKNGSCPDETLRGNRKALELSLYTLFKSPGTNILVRN